MKNVIKKIASITMAFTLLGTGTAVTKKISLKTYKIFTASALETDKNGWFYFGTVPKVIATRKNGKEEVFSDARGIKVYVRIESEKQNSLRMYIPNRPGHLDLYNLIKIRCIPFN